MSRWLVLALVLGSCQRLLGFEEATVADRDAAPPSDTAPLDDTPPPTFVDGSDEAAPLTCPATYITVTGQISKYRNVTDKVITWQSANSDCAADGAGTHLVVLTDAAEHAAMVALASDPPIWIGHSDRKIEGSFLPVTDEPTTYVPATSMPPWAPGQPSGEDCVLLDPSGDLAAQSCNQSRRFICECDGASLDQNNF